MFQKEWQLGEYETTKHLYDMKQSNELMIKFLAISSSLKKGEVELKELYAVCENLYQKIIHEAQNTINSITKPISGLKALTVAVRVKHIQLKLTKGMHFNDVFAPYELKDSRSIFLKNVNLFDKIEEELKEEIAQETLKLFIFWATRYQNKFKDFLSPWDWKDAYTFLVSQNLTDESIAILISVLLNNITDTKADSYVFTHAEILKKFKIKDKNWEELILNCLCNYQGYLDAIESKLMGIFFQLILSDRNCILFTNLTNWVASLNIDKFFNLIKAVSLTGSIEKFIHAQFNPQTDAFKILLMTGFDYHRLFSHLLNDMSNHRSHISSIFYEALSRGDFGTIKTILDASNMHEINREMAKEKTSFDEGTTTKKIKTMFHTETTQYSDKISYNLKDLLIFLKQKFTITENPQQLYFVEHLDDFARLLLENKLITNINKFKKQVNVLLNLNLSLENEDVPMTDNLEERVSTLEKDNTQLKASNVALMQELIALKNKYDQLEEKLLNIAQALENSTYPQSLSTGSNKM